MILLLQFLLRLSFGLATGMALTSARQVTSGYFRNHLYVTMGLTLLAALVSRSVAAAAFWPAVLALVASYVGSIFWLYEKPRYGLGCLMLVAGLALLAAWFSLPGFSLPGISLAGASYPGIPFAEPSVAAPSPAGMLPLATDNHGDIARGEGAELPRNTTAPVSSYFAGSRTTGFGATEFGGLGARNTLGRMLRGLDTLSSGLLLGITMAAMLLGHWYLNSPTMELAPLKKLILAMAVAVALQGAISAVGLWGNIDLGQQMTTQWILFLLIRWLFGLVGVSVLTWMAWQTIKIPNTQSATGILYVAVIGTFVGETTSLLLSSGMPFPL